MHIHTHIHTYTLIHIHHDILIHRLHTLGISDAPLLWFKFYLSNRSFSVQIGESLSSPIPLLTLLLVLVLTLLSLPYLLAYSSIYILCYASVSSRHLGTYLLTYPLYRPHTPYSPHLPPIAPTFPIYPPLTPYSPNLPTIAPTKSGYIDPFLMDFNKNLRLFYLKKNIKPNKISEYLDNF